MNITLDGGNPAGVTSVETTGDETPLDAYNITMALTADTLTEEQLDHLNGVYSDDR